MPNHLTVEGTQDVPPLTTGQKFKLTAQGVFDPYEFAIVGVLAGINQATDKDNSYGQGGAGYGKRYGAGFADQAIGNFMTGAVFPTLLREDPRYFQLGHGKVRHRAWYALNRMVITRKDSGSYGFNYSEWLGNASAAGIAMAYRDQQDRNVANVADTWVEQMAVDAASFELKEFWPDIHHWLFRGKKRQQGQPTSPPAA